LGASQCTGQSSFKVESVHVTRFPAFGVDGRFLLTAPFGGTFSSAVHVKRKETEKSLFPVDSRLKPVPLGGGTRTAADQLAASANFVRKGSRKEDLTTSPRISELWINKPRLRARNAPAISNLTLKNPSKTTIHAQKSEIYPLKTFDTDRLFL